MRSANIGCPSAGEVTVLSKFTFGENYDQNNYVQWICPYCTDPCVFSRPGKAIEHIRSDHKALAGLAVQCWRVKFDSAQVASYYKTSRQEAVGSPPTQPAPSDPASSRHQAQPAPTAGPEPLQTPVRQAKKSKRTELAAPRKSTRQRTSFADVPSRAAANKPSGAAAAPNAAPSPASTAKPAEPGQGAASQQARSETIAKQAERAPGSVEQQAMPDKPAEGKQGAPTQPAASFDTPTLEVPQGSSRQDKLEICRMGIEFLKKMATL